MAVANVETLRREFDGAFARAVRETADDSEDLLAVRVGGSPYALRVAELGGVSAGRRITPVPSSHAGLLGLVGIRGSLVPVFDLARLLDEQQAGEVPRWIAWSQGDSPVGLAFATVEGHLRVPASALELGAAAERTLVEKLVRVEAGLRPVVSVGNVVKWLEGRARSERPDTGKG